MGIMPLIGLLSVASATVAYGATTTVTLGVGDTSVLVEGKTSPDSFVTIIDGGNIVGTTSAGSDGLFSKKITAVQPGIHRLQIYARDTQNRLTDSIQIEMSATEHFQTDIYAFLPPTIAADQPIINPGQAITYRGATYPNAEITLFFNEDQEYTIAADNEGLWSQSIPTDDLSLGTYEAYAYATDISTAEQSYSTRKLAVSILLPAPQPLPVEQQPKPTPSPTQPRTRTLRPTTITPLPDATVSESPITITGTAEPMAQIELYNGGRPVGSTFADKKGKWSITLSLQELEYILRARACTTVACSSLTNSIRFLYQPTNNGRQFWVWLGQYAYVAPAGSTIAIRTYTGNGSSPYDTTVTWGDDKQDRSQYKDNNFTVRHTYKHAGEYKGTVTITDSNNHSAMSMFTARIMPVTQSQSFLWPLVLLLLCVFGFIATTSYTHWHLHRHRNKSK